MKWLTEDAIIKCTHSGVVQIVTSQSVVTIGRRRVLVENDPENRSIVGCPNYNPAIGIKPCTNTLKVQAGYSDFLRINGHRVCLDTVVGLTDGTPPGEVNYEVLSPGQEFVTEVS